MLLSQPFPSAWDGRHRTLRAAIQWSYGLLPPELAGAFRSLAVFQGGWQLEAVVAVCAGRSNGMDTAQLLSYLVERSLIEIEVSEVAEPRLRLLEVVREFAWEKLAEAGGERQARGVHARYYLSLAEALVPDLVGPKQAQALARLRQEAGNLQVALTWCYGPEGDTETGVRLALGAVPVLGDERPSARGKTLVCDGPGASRS